MGLDGDPDCRCQSDYFGVVVRSNLRRRANAPARPDPREKHFRQTRLRQEHVTPCLEGAVTNHSDGAGDDLALSALPQR
jgi:hypothetical protein